ncbi:MAG: alpha-amylase, partial [Polaromonas sp.]
SIEELPQDVHGAYLAVIAKLGERTAQLHLAFAQRSDDPAFAPETLGPADMARYRAQATDEARATFVLLEAGISRLPDDARNDAQALLAQRDLVLSRIESCTAETPAALKTRYHGDFHLGQVLLAKNDVVIIDFEGEPARSFEERRAKQSPLRDVAGMLRSFSYAQWSALRHVAQDAQALDKLAPLARAWETEVRQTFLQDYDQVAGNAGIYQSLDPERGLLGLFELEKALYELRYEIGNRPDWVRIPLLGILGLAQTR